MGFHAAAWGAEPPAERLQIHPRVFALVTCWPSDTDEPVVTEVNLDAVTRNRNQFDTTLVKTPGEWTECPGEQGVQEPGPPVTETTRRLQDACPP